jgi:hypothetical protein
MARRAGLARTGVPAVIVVAGVVLTVVGVHTRGEGWYVGGLGVLALGGGVLVLRSRGVRRLGEAVAVVAALLLAAVVVTVGVEAPRQVLRQQLAGSGVAWRVDSPLVGVPVHAPLLLGQTAVVIGGRDGWVMMSTRDGRVLQSFDAFARQPMVAADNRLLMIPAGSNEAGDVVMYDDAGQELWRHTGTSVLAYAQGVTVVETCNPVRADCGQIGYRDNGSQAWRRESHSVDPPGRRIPSVQYLPTAGPDTPRVLPAIAAWPLSYSDAAVRWQFVDPATGRIMRTVTTPYAGAVGDTMISYGGGAASGRATFTLAWPDSSPPVVVAEPQGSSNVLPVALGPLLVLTNTLLARPTAIDIAEHVPVGERNVALPTADVAYGDARLLGAAGIGVAGVVTADGDVVDARPQPPAQGWQLHTSTPTAQVSVGAQTVVVDNELRRTTPFDDARGYQSGHSWIDVDHRITVLQLSTGRITGQLRLGHDDQIWAAGVADGVAVVADDHSLCLLGRSR